MCVNYLSIMIYAFLFICISSFEFSFTGKIILLISLHSHHPLSQNCHRILAFLIQVPYLQLLPCSPCHQVFHHSNHSTRQPGPHHYLLLIVPPSLQWYLPSTIFIHLWWVHLSVWCRLLAFLLKFRNLWWCLLRCQACHPVVWCTLLHLWVME